MTRYWIGVASKDHVQIGIKGGFCQLCHGKAQPLKRMSLGDGIIYYSPKEYFSKNIPCRQFTAIGFIKDTVIYQFEMMPGFTPFRRNVEFLHAKAVSIYPLLNQLTFIEDKKNWGYLFRFGFFEISLEDFEKIHRSLIF